jgi:putative PIN family toxin of toxin-antitoxin system
MVRVVVDTNVLVSALVYHGKSRALVVKLLEEHDILLSRLTLQELADVLKRDKFLVADSQVDRFLKYLLRKSKMVTPTSRFKVIAEDPDDDVVLNTAYKGKAKYIVTGDKHLLELKTFKKVEIVTVSLMFDLLKSNASKS